MIAHATGIAERTVATMRSTLAQWKVDNPGADPRDQKWETVKRGDGPMSKNDEWEEAQARKWAKYMGKTFGRQPGRLPHVFALAIERYSATLPDRLLEAWEDKVRDFADRLPDVRF